MLRLYWLLLVLWASVSLPPTSTLALFLLMNSEWESGFRHDAVALTLVHFRYVDQNNFLRSVKNVKVDDTQTHSDAYVCAFH